mgnify:FL=1
MLRRVAHTIRGLSADAVEQAKSGHPGMPLGAADIAAVLYCEALKHDPSSPRWIDRDRFVLSAGHGSMLLYSVLHLTGYDLPMSELKRFRQLGSKTAGHPEYGLTPGVETTTGPLGQGFANAVGMAIAERMLAARYNRPGYEIFNHYTYVLAGDGCMMEGITSEAASLAGHLKLDRLIVFYDDNDISIEGSTDLAFTESVPDRFRAYGWHVQEIDGHDLDAIRNAIKTAKEHTGQPSLIVAKTVIAWGSPTLAGSHHSHGAPLGPDEVAGLKKALGLPSEPFSVPDDVKEFLADRQKQWKAEHDRWNAMFEEWSSKYPELRRNLDAALAGELPEDLESMISTFEAGTKIATRNSSGKTLQQIAKAVPYLAGGSADLAPSTKTYLEGERDIAPGDFSGRNFHFGIREHAMAAICNGISLHGGIRPYCSTFLVFVDYMKPAVRLSALMKQPVIYVLTHDSIYVGEDGPTHEPIEQTESLRLIPNCRVFRPADANETRLAWIEAIKRKDGPTCLILTRQNLPTIAADRIPRDGFAKGGYVLKRESSGNPDLVLVAAGSEVSLCLETAEMLEADGVKTRVVSMPSRELFMSQDPDYRASVLTDAPKVAVEIGVGEGWYQITGTGGLVYSLQRFGESGPGEQVAAHLGFTASALREAIRKKFNL